MSHLFTEEVLGLIRQYVRYNIRKAPDLLRFSTEDDLVHDVVIKFIRHNHLEKFDPNRTSIKWHIANAVNTTLIDILRTEKHKRRELSSTQPMKNDPEEGEFLTIEDVTASHETSSEDLLYLADVLRDLKDNCKEWGDEVEVPILGTTRTSAFAVYFLHLHGFEKKQIAEMMNFKTPQRAGQLVREAESKLVELGHKTLELRL